jgi:general secretion pathway protein D
MAVGFRSIRPALVALALAAAQAACPPAAHAQVEPSGQAVTINLVDVDLRAAVQAMSQYLDRPVVFGALNGSRVTLQTPRPVPPLEVPALLRTLLEGNGYQLVADGNSYRVEPRGAAQPPSAPGAGQRFARPGAAAVGSDTKQLFVIRLRHARASDVAATINALYGRGGALGEVGDRRQTLADELRGNRLPPDDGADAAAERRASGSLGGDLVMVPDERTNALLVRASPADFDLIRQAVAEVDVRPLQVLIEAVVVEARRSSSFRLGLASLLDTTALRGTGARVSGGNAGLSDLTGLVLRLMDVGGGGVDLDLTLQAASARGDATIVSRPVVLAANNERAEVTVGDQIPFVQLRRTLPTENLVQDQVIQYLDVGTHLSVLPTISADGYVMLEVTQEVNGAGQRTELGAPELTTRSVQTRLLVRDGQTAVLGGLTGRRRAGERGGVPFLSRLPLVGWVFGSTAREALDTELFVFLTPRVLSDDAAMEAATGAVREAAPRVDRAGRSVAPIATSPEGTAPAPAATAVTPSRPRP